MSDLSERLGRVLSEHFVMWHEFDARDGLLPPGEWRCSCVTKFGFSDSAIRHQAQHLAAEVDAWLRESRPECPTTCALNARAVYDENPLEEVDD